MKKKYVLKNRKRFTVFVGVLVLLIGLSIFATTVYGYKEPGYKTMVVKRGDTLWDIARHNSTEGDIRIYIHKIKVMNNMKNSEIYQGTELKLPIK